MAKPTDITTGVQTVTAAGAVTGSLDTSALTGDYTVCVNVSALTAAKTAVIAIEDTASATPFNDAVQVAVFHVTGAVTTGNDKQFNVRKYQIPGTRFGTTNTALRVNVLSVTATPGLKLHAWLEQ